MAPSILKMSLSLSLSAPAQLDERMSKMKGVLTKTHAALQDKNQRVMELEARIEQLESEMGVTLDEKQRQISANHESATEIEGLKVELAELARSTGGTVEELQRRLKTSEDQLADVREEYRQYKSRALTLFKDKAIDTNQAKIQSLEAQVEALKREVRTTVSSLEGARGAQAHAEEELRAAVERAEEAEARAVLLKEKSGKTERLEGEMARLTSELEELRITHRQTLADLERRTRAERQAAEEERSALRLDNETLRKAKEQENLDLLFQNQRLQAQIAGLEDDLRRSLRSAETGESPLLLSRKPSDVGSAESPGGAFFIFPLLSLRHISPPLSLPIIHFSVVVFSPCGPHSVWCRSLDPGTAAADG